MAIPLGPSEHVVARLLDYWGRRTPWQRRLWNPGSLLVLDELIEAAELLQSGILNRDAVKDLSARARTRLQTDCGLGDEAVRGRLIAALSEIDTPSGLEESRYLAVRSRAGYLTRWSAQLATTPQPGPERLSRLVAAHLLDARFSPDALYRWVQATTADGVPPLNQLVDSAIDLESRPTARYDVAVPVRGFVRAAGQLPASCISQQALTAWLREHVDPEHRLRQGGGFLFTVEARDPWAAVEIAGERVETLAARVMVGVTTREQLEPIGKAFVKGSADTFALDRPRRQVEVSALARAGVLLDYDAPALGGNLAAAIELLALLEHSAPGGAVAGGWAAIEAVLSDGGNAVRAADDLARLIACSFPRAEMTTLAYKVLKFPDGSSRPGGLATAIRSAPSNRMKCHHLASAIAADAVEFDDPSDRAALVRMAEVLNHPKKVLARVSEYASDALRRLYRQRNSLLHAATTTVGLRSCLETVPPLVGAGFDRIVHAALANPSETPLRLCARARIELDLTGTPSGRHPVDLLEPS